MGVDQLKYWKQIKSDADPCGGQQAGGYREGLDTNLRGK